MHIPTQSAHSVITYSLHIHFNEALHPLFQHTIVLIGVTCQPSSACTCTSLVRRATHAHSCYMLPTCRKYTYFPHNSIGITAWVHDLKAGDGYYKNQPELKGEANHNACQKRSGVQRSIERLYYSHDDCAGRGGRVQDERIALHTFVLHTFVSGYLGQ